jgi:hypothetical protein
MDQLKLAESILKKNLLASKKVDEKGFQKNKEQNPEMFNAMLKAIIEFGGVVQPDNLLIGKSVEFLGTGASKLKGEVQLVFTDALASGTKDYVPITYLLVKTPEGNVFEVLPRNITKIN